MILIFSLFEFLDWKSNWMILTKYKFHNLWIITFHIIVIIDTKNPQHKTFLLLLFHLFLWIGNFSRLNFIFPFHLLALDLLLFANLDYFPFYFILFEFHFALIFFHFHYIVPSFTKQNKPNWMEISKQMYVSQSLRKGF